MRDIVSRAVRARPELTAALCARGAFTREEQAEIRQHCGGYFRSTPLGPIQFVTLLATGDNRLAARAVLRNLLDSVELRWLDRLLRFPGRKRKRRDELFRIVERALSRVMEREERKCLQTSLKFPKRSQRS